jgi:LysM repeat protein
LQPFPIRRTSGAAALEHVNIPRLARSLHAAAVLTVAAASAARAQEVRPDTVTRSDTTRSDSTTHTVKRGDTLWDLANAYLGDAYLWPELYRLNTDQIDDPHWIYPGEVLRLPGAAAAAPAAAPPAAVAAAPGAEPAGAPTRPARAPAVEEPPRRVAGPTIFRVFTRRSSSRDLLPPVRQPRVPFDDVLRAPYFDRQSGPRGTGVILVGADIPGIASPPQTANFQLYDKVLMTPPPGSVASERERFMAYKIDDYVEGVGSVVVPIAMLRVIRAPQNGEAAVAEVLELYGSLNANTRIVPIDTAGAGANAVPVRVTGESARTAKIRSIYRPVVLPSLNYYVLFDLKAEDGLRLGDEIEVYRPRQSLEGGDGPAVPEVRIATGQVVKVTAYGSTARITSQEQPAIRAGQSVRVTARMP